MKLPESGFHILVGSGAKEDKKLPESGFLVLVGSGTSNSQNCVLQQPSNRLCTSCSRRRSMAALAGSSTEAQAGTGPADEVHETTTVSATEVYCWGFLMVTTVPRIGTWYKECM